MRSSTLYLLLSSAVLSSFQSSFVLAQDSNVTDTIIANADACEQASFGRHCPPLTCSSLSANIDLSVLPFLDDALAEIDSVSNDTSEAKKRALGRYAGKRTTNSIVDVHSAST